MPIVPAAPLKPTRGRCSVHERTTLDCPRCEATRRNDAWTRWLASQLPWALCVHLDFDPVRAHHSRRDPSAISKGTAIARTRNWLRLAERRLARPLVAALFLARQPQSRLPHVHGVLHAAGGFTEAEVRLLARLWWGDPHTLRYGNGGCVLEPPKTRERCIAYAVNHLEQDPEWGEPVFWPPTGPLRGAREGWPREGHARPC